MKRLGSLFKATMRRGRAVGKPSELRVRSRRLALESLEDRRMLALLINAPGNGTVQVNVDGHGAFGYSVGGAAGEAFYDPLDIPVPTAAAGTTFASGVAIGFDSMPGFRRLLTSGSIFGVGLANAPTTGTNTTALSSFDVGGLHFDLRQVLSPLFVGNVRSGSVLLQLYVITNTTNAPIGFDLVRYYDGDLNFDLDLNDGGGRAFVQGTDVLFETDTATGSANEATFVGITAFGGIPTTANRWEVGQYSGGGEGVYTDRPLTNRTFNDGPDADQFVDAGNGYDVVLKLRNVYSIPAGQSASYVTRTIFGTVSPDDLQLPGFISGTVWDDDNDNGIRDPGEPGLANWEVFLDSNDNGTLDNNEISILTDANGDYFFSDVDAGTYTVAEVTQPPIYEQTFPTTTGGNHQVTVAQGQVVVGIDFGNRIARATITGVNFEDFNGNGIFDTGDTGAGGFTMYLDTNNNGALDAGEPTQITNLFGGYTFKDLDAGTYTVREVPRANWVQTFPAAGFYTVTVAQGQTVADRNFGNQFQGGFVSGTNWGDYDADRIFDSNEPPLAGWTIYVDTNNNGVLDSGEPSQVTDGSGTYSFRLLAGTYTIRQVPQMFWQQSFPVGGVGHTVTINVGQRITNRDFGNDPDPGEIHGAKWWDINENGARDPGEPGAANFIMYADLNGDGVRNSGEPFDTTDATGQYSITNLNPGSYRILEVPRAGWEQTFPSGGAGHNVAITAGLIVTGRDFGNRALPGSVSGVKYFDANQNGVLDAGDTPLADFAIYADLDGDEVISLGEPADLTDSEGRYTITNLAPGTYAIREVFQPGWIPVAPASGSQQVVIDAGQHVTGVHYGSRSLVDYGDAPASYATRLADGGPNHRIMPGFYLGTTVDGEADGTPSVTAVGDDQNAFPNDEDGIVFLDAIAPGRTVRLQATASIGGGYLQAWIDYDANGVFDDPAEKVVADKQLLTGPNVFMIDIPTTAVVGLTYGRFRYGFDLGIGPTGPSLAGEVEDHAVVINAPPPPALLGGDYDEDGRITLLDIVLLRDSLAGIVSASEMRSEIAQLFRRLGETLPGDTTTASPAAAPQAALAADAALSDATDSTRPSLVRAAVRDRFVRGESADADGADPRIIHSASRPLQRRLAVLRAARGSLRIGAANSLDLLSADA